jgi:hypothetical protein
MKKKILAAVFATALPALLISNSASAVTLPADGVVAVVANTFITSGFTLVVSDGVILNYLNGGRSVAVDTYHPKGTIVTGNGGRVAANGETVQAFGGTTDGGTVAACSAALTVSTPQVVDAQTGAVTTAAIIGGC